MLQCLYVTKTRKKKLPFISVEYRDTSVEWFRKPLCVLMSGFILLKAWKWFHLGTVVGVCGFV